MAVKKAKKTSEVKTVVEAVKVKAAPAARAKKKAPAAPKAKKAAVSKLEPVFDPNCFVVIDHPIDAEVVTGLHYAIRIGASDNGAVEIAFDGTEWQPCRQAAGYWWFDWGYFAPGVHTINARLRDADGNTIIASKTVTVTVS